MPFADNQSIDEIADYYEATKIALNHYKNSIKKESNLKDSFLFYSEDELNGIFKNYENILEINCSFNLLSALEAYFRIDFETRNRLQQTDKLSKELIKIYPKKERDFVSLFLILKIWLKYSSYKNEIGTFQKLIDYRNWIAHGRYSEFTDDKSFNYQNILIFSKIVENSIPFLS
ncbi:MAG: hypothetical protein U9N62_10180 [Thermotogota bacterium]|nr:hypothetical protein [Thermotogota bacterium]